MHSVPLPDPRNVVAAVALNNVLFKTATTPTEHPQHVLDLAMEAHDAIEFLVLPSTPYCLHPNNQNPSYRSYHRVNARQCLPSEHAPGLSVWRVQEVQGGAGIGKGDLVSVWLDSNARVSVVGLVRQAAVVKEGLVRLTLADKEARDIAILFIPSYLTTFKVIDKVLMRMIPPTEPCNPTPPFPFSRPTASVTSTGHSFTGSHTSQHSDDTTSPSVFTSISASAVSRDSFGTQLSSDGAILPDDIILTSVSRLVSAIPGPDIDITVPTPMSPYTATIHDVREAFGRSAPRVDQATAQLLNYYIRYENVPFCCLFGY